METYIHSVYQIRNNIMLPTLCWGSCLTTNLRHNLFCLYCLSHLQSNPAYKTHYGHIDGTLNNANLLNLSPSHVSLVGWGEERTPTFK